MRCGVGATTSLGCERERSDGALRNWTKGVDHLRLVGGVAKRLTQSDVGTADLVCVLQC